MVDVAQLVEPRIVIPAVAGSSPVVHPTFHGWVRVGSVDSLVYGPLAQLVEQLTLNQLVLIIKSITYGDKFCPNRLVTPQISASTGWLVPHFFG